LVYAAANTTIPSIGLCIEFLLVSKYVRVLTCFWLCFSPIATPPPHRFLHRTTNRLQIDRCSSGGTLCSLRRAKYEFKLVQVDADMKNSALALTLVSGLLFPAAAGTLQVNAAENSWTTKAPMHSGRGGAGVATVNGIVYAIGGQHTLNSSNTELKTVIFNAVEAYDPATDIWTEKAPMPTLRSSFGTAVYQNKIYCIGGSNERGVIGVNEVYDPSTDTWETKAPMSIARSGLQANVVDGKIYLIGGWYQSNSTYRNVGVSAQVDIFDPSTDTWTTGAPMPTAVAGYASAVVDNRIYVISGKAGGSATTTLTQMYNPRIDKWSLGAPIPMGVSGAAAGATTGVQAPKAIYVFGGANDTYPLNGQYTNQVYSPATNSWGMAAPMPIDRGGLGVAVVNDKFYVIGGGHNIFTPASTVNMQYTPISYGTVPPAVHVPPEISVTSPQNKTYNDSIVALTFAVDKTVAQMDYCLDGQGNVTVAGNATLTGLANGAHNLTVYVKDTEGGSDSSENVAFTIAKPEPFQTVLVVATSVVTVLGVGAGLLVYLKKRKR
jgi:N-acetylneuraminic acid mutarotase